MKHVLFVDDEPNIIQGLKRMLFSLRGEWDMAFFISATEALKEMANNTFDVVVSDMRMPGMDGGEFLQRVKEDYPRVVRIVLSGHTDKESILRSIGPAHQYLAKPCNAETLKNTVARACALRDLLADEALNSLVASVDSLPSIPSLYMEIVQELRSASPSIRRVGDIISSDVGMTAKILQLVNSAFFGLRRNISNPAQAVSLLGLDIVKALVLSVQVFSLYENKKVGGFSIEYLWNHSLNVSRHARVIAAQAGKNKKIVDDSFMAGMLHDLGKLVLVANEPERFHQTRELAIWNSIPIVQAEAEVFGTTHAEVGAYLLGLWGLQNPIVETLAFHHTPSICQGLTFTPLTAVHIANVFDYELGGQEDESLQELDVEHIEGLGLSSQIDRWRDLCTNLQESEVA